MTTIQNIRVQYFCPPLDEVLEDAKHGAHTHFELRQDTHCHRSLHQRRTPEIKLQGMEVEFLSVELETEEDTRLEKR